MGIKGASTTYSVFVSKDAKDPFIENISQCKIAKNLGLSTTVYYCENVQELQQWANILLQNCNDIIFSPQIIKMKCDVTQW